MNTPSNAHLQDLGRAAARESSVVTIDDASSGRKFRRHSGATACGARLTSVDAQRTGPRTTSRGAVRGQDSA